MLNNSEELSHQITEMIRSIPVGGEGRICFPGHAGPVHISITTSKGWTFKYTLIPGMDMEFVKGEDEFVEISIDIDDATGLKPGG
ncbi:hypothetical protein SAMN05216198_1041 [Halopseudomonas litoralis]|uniref:Uncharacterized protein n=1 Tax=Halopseudomonas litoralis TaxID=797277 RepID=A0A1H1NY97_9GAMM|nr:hypothetical protein [Halopseudomonas litoralis]SDS03922.1 hypothetical protein SAMN05216198_1041 [Halopseudomonas litoralis]